MDLPYRDADLQLPPPAPLHFRYDQFEPHTDFGLHRHPWGQLNRISLGLIELEVDGSKLTAPADYLVWVPADLPHAAYVRLAMAYTSVYVDDALAARLPAGPCLIQQTPVVRALLEDFCQRRVTAMAGDWDVRQAELLVEHLVRAGAEDSYLPESADRQLAPILHAIRLDPADATTLAQWAEQVHSTERTLARRFQRELGMSFVQWRNRVRLLQALAWLKEGWPVQEIAARLSYGTASAFIAMFRKQIGFSPERYRRQLRGEA
ncbi:AraC family transcriptional regulator [Pseudogulbenkiania subflava]|uniref:Transcriptional regulator, AraC family n=1 Tax=Pseudogulbenkiania subflava DSM 22618 TaxID=1123014 RepID=A0A1Y6BIM3_9NEIS|nr:helix-turn-helix transcriptional regulator [Pseudogulbenkiania subflava]SMF05648.1 transcriptional regulator, AraC family [Pseudogulbenkiania subflava DSM 22618]